MNNSNKQTENKNEDNNQQFDKQINNLLNDMLLNKNTYDYNDELSTKETRISYTAGKDYSYEEAIQQTNAKVLLDTLAPQIEQNENKKREHKDKLIKYVSIFIGAQFVAVFVFIFTVIISMIVFHALRNDFSKSILNIIFGFYGTYITSVVVELIFILKFIVNNVFDTSISALMEIFKSPEVENNKNKQSSEEKR